MGLRGCVRIRIFCVYVSAGGAGCPLLSKQQKYHPLPCDWCGHWRFYLIRGPDSQTGTMLLSLLFLAQLWSVQLAGADTGGQYTAKESGAAEQNKWLNWEGRLRIENREKGDASDKQMHNARAAWETIWNHNTGMQGRGHKMNDELLCRDLILLSGTGGLFLGGIFGPGC